jgi:RNA processing factor Prp31
VRAPVSNVGEGSLNEIRFKLKFSPDKVDTMVVQAIVLLDDLDKEINIYAMRVKVRIHSSGLGV